MTVYECFILYRTRWVRRLFAKTLIQMVIERCKKMPPQECITLLHALLLTSRNPAFSKLLLTLLGSFPEEALERHGVVRTYFVRQSLKSSSVKEGISACQTALELCFEA